MSPAEAVEHYLAEKKKNELSSSSIRKELEAKHLFSGQEVNDIMRTISNLELEEIQESQSPLNKLLGHLYFSYFFILFGLSVITTSIYFIYSGGRTGIAKLLPWVMILGGIFIIAKHISRIYQHKNLRGE